LIDQSSLKTPGWARIVAELHAPAPDDRTFLHRLVAILAQVSGARQGVLFAVERAEGSEAAPDPRPMFVWPTDPARADPEIEHAPDCRAAARSSGDAGQLQIFGISGGGAFYGEEDRGSIIAVPVPTGVAGEAAAPGPQGVITLLVESRSRQALQTTTALVEVLAGYTLLHATRQQLRRSRASTASLDLATRLIAALNTAPSFKGASFQLVNDLARQMRADRVAMGWVRGIGSSGAIRAIAMSDTEMIDRRMAMVQKLEAAMDECLDQEQAVLFPPPPADSSSGTGGDAILSQAITHAHRELAAADARLKVVSLPLRDGDKVVGVMTIESSAEGPADIASIELVQAALDLVSPVLIVKRSDDRALPMRAGVSAQKAGRWIVGPKHTGWKLAGVALFAGLVAATLVHLPYNVEAPIEIQPRIKYVVSVPFDGIVRSLPEGIEAGRVVHKGDVLVQMDTEQIMLQVAQSKAEINQAQKEADANRQAKKLAEAKQAEARAEQARAKLGQAEYERDHATLTAPIDGTIIAGDLSDKIGAAVRLGDVLFQIAPLDDMTIVARVSDRDIDLLHDGREGAAATTGEVATKANPALGYPCVIERIVPLAQPKDGKNAFEVRARLTEPARSLRPGMEGFVHLDTGRHSLMWIATRRIRDQLRLWLWW
jgi:hypothetical protein